MPRKRIPEETSRSGVEPGREGGKQRFYSVKSINQLTSEIMNTTTQNQATQEKAQSQAPKLTADQELVFKLKQSIDNQGRYAYRLNDMSAGYAAGKGIQTEEARKEIEASFTKNIGKSPKDYLEQRFETRKSKDQGMSR